MKISRMQLRNIILNEIRVLPSLKTVGIPDEYADRIMSIQSAAPESSDLLAQSFGYEGEYSKDMEDAFNEPYEILRSNAYPLDQWPLQLKRNPYIIARITGEYDYYDEDRGDIPYYNIEYVDIKKDNTVRTTSAKRYSLHNTWEKRQP